MLSTELSTFLGIFSLVLVLIAFLFAVAAAKLSRYCRSAVGWVMENNKNAVSLRQIAELSAEVTDLRDAYQSLLDSHKKLRSRIGMRQTREKRKIAENGESELSSENDKKALRIAAKQSGLLR